MFPQITTIESFFNTDGAFKLIGSTVIVSEGTVPQANTLYSVVTVGIAV